MSLDDWITNFDQFEVCLLPNVEENGVMVFKDEAYFEKIGSFRSYPCEEYFIIRIVARQKADEKCTWIQVLNLNDCC